MSQWEVRQTVPKSYKNMARQLLQSIRQKPGGGLFLEAKKITWTCCLTKDKDIEDIVVQKEENMKYAYFFKKYFT